MTSRSPKVSPQLEAELHDKLVDLLKERRDVADKKKKVAKGLKWQLDLLDDSIALVLRQLDGEDLDQKSLPGTELPEPKRDPVIAEILRLAGGIVDRDTKDEPEEDGEPTTESKILQWKDEERITGAFVASAPGGAYYLIPSSNPGSFVAEWRPDTGTKRTLAFLVELEQAKTACSQDLLERAGDRLLDENGSGDLNERSTKGDAVARRPRRT